MIFVGACHVVLIFVVPVEDRSALECVGTSHGVPSLHYEKLTGKPLECLVTEPFFDCTEWILFCLARRIGFAFSVPLPDETCIRSCGTARIGLLVVFSADILASVRNPYRYLAVANFVQYTFLIDR